MHSPCTVFAQSMQIAQSMHTSCNSVLGMTLNSSVVVQGMTVKLRPCLRFWACGWGCVRWKAPAGKGVVGLLSWHGSHFWVCITFCKVRHGDSVTKPETYYIIIVWHSSVTRQYNSIMVTTTNSQSILNPAGSSPFKFKSGPAFWDLIMAEGFYNFGIVQRGFRDRTTG